MDDVALAVPLVGIERTKELATALAIRASLGVRTPRVARGEASSTSDVMILQASLLCRPPALLTMTAFCAFLRHFSGKREKDQVSIGSGWWQWTQQASARIPSTVRSYFPMSNLERWIGPAQVTSHPSHASPTRTAFRSRVLRRRAGRKCRG